MNREFQSLEVPAARVSSPWKLLAAASLLCACTGAVAQLPAFPGAEGFGAHALGGRGGDVYHVVNLNSSGAGSFADGIATVPARGRTIVFDVGGWIHLSANTRLTASNVTIAGQTAPGDGIGFKDGTFWIYGDNVVIRHARFRYGEQAAGGDCIDVDSAARNVLFDHCTFEFSTDENFSTWNPPENLTMQDSINAWGLDPHSCGGLLNANHMSVIRCLWAHNHTRNPKARPEGLLDWINNVTFDWDIGFIMGDSTTPADWKANVRGCYFVAATSKSYALEKASIDRNGGTNFHLYLDHSVLDGNNNGLLDTSKTNYAMASGSYGKPSPLAPYPQTANGQPVASNNPIVGVATAIDPALLSYKKVLSSAGPVRLDALSALPLRDEVDTILIGDVFAQTRRIIGNQGATGAGNGGFGTLNPAPPPVDTDRDGLPDFWETAMSLGTSVDDHTNQVPAGAFLTNAPAGYTALEEYLHWLATPHAFTLRNQMLSVDLRRYVQGFTNRSPVYTVSSPVNGAVALTNGVYARFWPASNAFGRASFLFAVSDADGSAWTQQFLVCVSPAAPPKSVIWRGDGVSNQWNNLVSANWHDGNSLVTFGPGDTVTFDDSGSNTPAIGLASGSLAPAGMTFASAKNYTLGGTGTLSGGATLRKSGTGTLTFANSGANSFTGGVVVGQGGVNVGANGQLGTGPLTLAGGSFGFNNGGTLANDVAVVATGTIFAWNSCWMTGDLTGQGYLWLGIPGGDLITPEGDWSAFAGTVDLGAGTGSLRLNHGANPWGSATARFVLGSGTLKNRSTGSPTIHLGLLGGDAPSLLYGSDQAGAFTDTYSIGALGEDSTFSGTIANGGAHSVQIVKTGGGTLTLHGLNTFGGGLIVSNGTLAVNGATGTGAVRVVAGTLGGTGRVNGAVTMLAGTTLAPGSSAGTLSISNGLAMSNAVLRLELSTSPTGTNDLVALTNSVLRLLGTNEVVISLPGGYLGSGTYSLVRGGTQTVGSAANLRLNGVAAGSRQQINLSAPAGLILLNVTGTVQSLTWRGTHSGAWDFNSSTNWLNATNGPDTFFNFDAVRFDDSSTNGTVAISNSVSPRSVEVANTNRSYTVGGGALSGLGALSKWGAGAMALTGSNDFSGGVVLHGGSITLANDTANTHGPGTGPLTIHGGTLYMHDNAASYNDSYWDLMVPAGATGTVWADSRVDFHGDVSGGGVLNFRVPFVRTTLFGDWSAFTGRLHVLADADGGDFRIGSDYAWPGLPSCAMDLADKTHLIWSGNLNSSDGSTMDIGQLSGTASSSLVGGPVAGRTLRYRIGGLGTDAVFNGTIGEQAAGDITAIEKTGAGAWTLTGTNTYVGGTTVSAGSLFVNSSGAGGTGSGGVVVGSGARIGGNGVIGGPLTVGDGAVLSPGRTDSPGTLTVNDDATVNDGAMLWFRLGATSDRVVVSGSLQLGGSLCVSNSGGFAGGIFPLFTCAGDLDLGLLAIAGAPTGYVYSIDTNTPGVVQLFALTPFMQWQLANFGSLTNPSAAAGADFDGDGFPNGAEFQAGTQPTNPASLLAFVSEIRSGTNLVVVWKTAGIRTNIVQVSVGSLTNFTDAGGPMAISAPGDATTNFTAPAPTSPAPRFYRIRLP